MQSIAKKDIRLLVDEGIYNNKTILTLKKDVSELKTDVSELKTDVAVLKTDMTEVKDGMHRQGIMMEDMRDNINVIVEGISPLLRKSESLDELDEKLEENNDQITIVKTTLKSHIENKDIHRKD